MNQEEWPEYIEEAEEPTMTLTMDEFRCLAEFAMELERRAVWRGVAIGFMIGFATAALFVQLLRIFW